MNRLVHQSSQPCAKSELDLFVTPATQEMILGGKWVDVHPIGFSPSDGNVPLLFEIKGCDDYIDVSQTYISFKVKFLKADGSDLAGTEAIGPVNALLYAMMSQIDVTIANDLITTLTNLDNYKAIFQLLTNYSPDALNSMFQCALFYKDTAGNMDSIKFLPGTNNVDVPKFNYGLHARNKLMGASNEITLIGRLTADFFLQNRYLLDNTDLTIKISRCKNSFCYIGTGDYKMKILGSTLHVRKVQINPEVRLAHAHCLEKSNAKYPLTRVDMKPISIPKNSRNFYRENLCSGALPSRIIFGLVDSEAFNGKDSKNPFNFQHFNLSSVQFQVESVDFPYKPFETNYSANNYTEAYFSHFLGVNKSISDSGSIIDRNDFANGYALYAFDLSADLCNQSHFNLIKSGNLRMVLNFDTDTVVNIVCIVYFEYQNMIEINKNRQVIFDYNIK
jgi:hypothetical protein